MRQHQGVFPGRRLLVNTRYRCLSALAWATWKVSILPGPNLTGSQPAAIRGKNGPQAPPGPYPIPTFLEIRVPLIH